MTALLALAVGTLAIGWLLRQDIRERADVSPATWLVVGWIVIHSTRPVTTWFSGSELAAASPQAYDEGNASEALVNLTLIAGGLLTLGARRVRLREVITPNRVLAAVYLFWLLSAMWSDYPVITLKRWIKDAGNIVMVLVVLTAREPGLSMRAVAVRCAYVVVPLSALLIRFFPGVGRVYVGYDGSELSYVGVATNKNSLGVLALVLALFVLWDLLRGRREKRRRPSAVGARIVVLGLCWYLLAVADSVTSLICGAIGSIFLLAFETSWAKHRPARLELLAMGTAAALLLIDWAVGIKEALVQGLGRDMTLTTRTEVWPLLMRYQENPLLGAGFNSFWAGERLLLSYERLGGIIQAHNGYLETYLNGGWLGVGLLLALLAVSYGRIRRGLRLGHQEAPVRFVILLVAIVYNYSEASFFKVGILWLCTLMAVMEYWPPRREAASLARPARLALARGRE